MRRKIKTLTSGRDKSSSPELIFLVCDLEERIKTETVPLQNTPVPLIMLLNMLYDMPSDAISLQHTVG